MLVTKVTAGEQRNCGLILNPTKSEVKLTVRGSWLEIGLAEVSFENGIFTCVTKYNGGNNIHENIYPPGEEHEIWLSGRYLFLLANRSESLDNSYEYDSDLVTFEVGEYYASSKGMKLPRQPFPYVDDLSIQLIAAFYGVHIQATDPFPPLNRRYSVLNTPPDFQLQIEQSKTGVKSGQFVL